MTKSLFAAVMLFLILTRCTQNDVKPSSTQKPIPIETGEFIFGRTSGPDTFAPTPYNIYKIAGGKLYGAYIPRINPDSLNIYSMTPLSNEKYQLVSNLPSLLPSNVFSETKTLIGMINIDSGYDFVKVSLEAGATKFFYIGDAGYPDYISGFKQALDQDLVRLLQ